MPATRSQTPFVGSPRQVRGAVVRVLRRRAVASIAELASETGHPIARVREAISSLASDGIVHADSARAQPLARDRVRLAG
jgi:hypothetical protein